MDVSSSAAAAATQPPPPQQQQQQPGEAATAAAGAEMGELCQEIDGREKEEDDDDDEEEEEDEDDDDLVAIDGRRHVFRIDDITYDGGEGLSHFNPNRRASPSGRSTRWTTRTSLH